MNHYETVYIVHPAIQEGRLNDIITKFHNKISKLKGEVLYLENWGKKKLAYAIEKQKYGTFVMCQYSLDSQAVKEISQELELNPNILRYLISKIESLDVKEGSNKLEIKDKADAPKSKEVENDVKEESRTDKVEVNEASEEVIENDKESISEDKIEEDA